MKYILCKLLLLAAAIYLLANYYTINMTAIMAVLTGVIINSGMVLLLKDKNDTHTIKYIFIQAITCFFLACGIFCPPITALIPYTAYNVYTYRLYSAPAWAVLALSLTAKDNISCTLIIVLLTAISAYMSYANKLNNSLSAQLHIMRDTAKEQNILIKENNRQLRENQDAKIYMATLQERNRIAREIHDNVGHMLTRSILQVGAVKVMNRDDRLSVPIEELRSTLDEAMTSMRNSVHDLHDKSIDLKSSIEKITENATGFCIDFDYDMSRDVPQDIKYAFIAIVREAVNNAIKYSNGNKITIILTEHPGLYRLLVKDNGSNSRIAENGIGLSNIRERIDALHGNLNISCENGFCILAAIMKKPK